MSGRRPTAKRAFDILCCLALAPFALLLGLIAALLVSLSSPGPIIYRARRVGRNGVVFTMFKFRTMVDLSGGPLVTSGRDLRITKVGRPLRRTKLDELPQLVNVLRGDMSIVGPRPEDPAYVEQFSEGFSDVLSVRPGITGLATVRFRDEELMMANVDEADVNDVYISRFLPAKLEIDRDYVARHSIVLDMWILAATVMAVLGRPIDRVL